MTIYFNSLLALGNLDPAAVRLLRRIDKQPGRQRKIVETAPVLDQVERGGEPPLDGGPRS